MAATPTIEEMLRGMKPPAATPSDPIEPMPDVTSRPSEMADAMRRAADVVKQFNDIPVQVRLKKGGGMIYVKGKF